MRRRNVASDEDGPLRSGYSAGRPQQQPASGGLCSCKTVSLLLLLGTGALTTYLACLPCPVKVFPFTWPPPRAESGVLQPNNALARAQQLLSRQANAPESFVLSDDGRLFSGTHDGKIIEITNDKITNTWRLMKEPEKHNCDGSYAMEPVCGRPLGLRLRGRTLYIVDTYLGLFTLNIDTGAIDVLYDGVPVVAGRRAMFLNDLLVLSDTRLLLTDSSYNFARRDVLSAILAAAPDGRLLEFDVRTKRFGVVSEQLHFANGLVHVPEEDAVLVAETTMLRITKIMLSGAQRGEHLPFVDNLPGLPDNIRRATNGNIWVPMSSVRDPAMQILGPRPWTREILFKLMDSYTLDVVVSLVSRPSRAQVLQVDAAGNIVRSWDDTRATTLEAISQVIDVGPDLYLGSWKSPFLAKLPNYDNV